MASELRLAIDRKAERGTLSRLSEAMGLDSPQQLSHRLAGDCDFSVVELGIAADFFDAPVGWPFIPWAIAKTLTVKR